MRRILITTALLLFVASSVAGGEDSPKKTANRWTPPNYAKVVGYRFKLPSDDATGPVKNGFTLIRKNGLDMKQLDALKIKSAELTREQIQQLTTSLSSGEVTYPAACYDPHHIFVFYDGHGNQAGAVEVCISCTGISTLPPLAKPLWYCHDFIRLARLVDALGLWLEPRTVSEYETLHRDREGK